MGHILSAAQCNPLPIDFLCGMVTWTFWMDWLVRERHTRTSVPRLSATWVFGTSSRVAGRPPLVPHRTSERRVLFWLFVLRASAIGKSKYNTPAQVQPHRALSQRWSAETAAGSAHWGSSSGVLPSAASGPASSSWDHPAAPQPGCCWGSVHSPAPSTAMPESKPATPGASEPSDTIALLLDCTLTATRLPEGLRLLAGPSCRGVAGSLPPPEALSVPPSAAAATPLALAAVSWPSAAAVPLSTAALPLAAASANSPPS